MLGDHHEVIIKMKEQEQAYSPHKTL